MVRTGGAEPSGAPGAAGTEQCAGTADAADASFAAGAAGVGRAETCLLYTADAADDLLGVDLVVRRTCPTT
ncbi:hypothetical protein, partial [Mycobacterium tuberculosis]|uniref:hypothetical protein n=1 Tax=Mycobacterium tuberculosis TaxID=1773 RepID=UPI0035AC1828